MSSCKDAEKISPWAKDGESITTPQTATRPSTGSPNPRQACADSFGRTRITAVCSPDLPRCSGETPTAAGESSYDSQPPNGHAQIGEGGAMPITVVADPVACPRPTVTFIRHHTPGRGRRPRPF